MWRGRLGTGTGTAAALHFLDRRLAPSTMNNYNSQWSKFSTFCATAKPDALQALPASHTTIACYIGYLGERGTVHAASLQPYLSAINNVHRDFDFDPPALGHLVARVRAGLADAQALVHKKDARLQLPAAECETIMQRMGPPTRTLTCGTARRTILRPSLPMGTPREHRRPCRSTRHRHRQGHCHAARPQRQRPTPKRDHARHPATY